MITLRNGVTAFLERGDQILLIKRAANRKIAPGVWSGVGGHMEPAEINDPLAACFREIFEESGISQENISGLKLRYIVLRKSKDEIRQNYIYFGKTNASDTTETDEGTLHWIPKAELLYRTFTQTFSEMLRHYVSVGIGNENLYVGAAESGSGALRMVWAVLEDFEP